MSRFSNFIRDIAFDTYPEPRSTGHDAITVTHGEGFMSKLPAPATILDVGCGQGPALELFGKHGHRTIGIALNPEDVKICTGLGYDVREMDQNAMPAAWSKFYDGVWARHVLEHSVAPYFTLKEFARVLKPGGWLYVEVPAPDTACQHETNPNHYSVMGARMWGELLMRSGFDWKGTVNEIRIQTGAGPDLYLSFLVQKLP